MSNREKEIQAASKRQRADPADLAADLERGFKLEPGVRDAMQVLADSSASNAEDAGIGKLLAEQSRKRQRSS